MDLRYLTPTLAVAPQIALADMAEAARMGFRLMINNRPDSEVPAALGNAAMRAQAMQAGLDYVYLPCDLADLTPELLIDFEKALAQAQGPVLAWCRSGTRCCYLWAFSQAGHRPLDEIIQMAETAGYDVSPLVPMLEDWAQARTETT